MKRRLLFFALPLCLAFLSGCENTAKLPTTKYEKVQYALNGVEKSLANQKGAVKKNNLLPKKKRSEGEAIDAIYSIFTEGTASEPDFKYDEPPMIQFSYIKKTLEKIGNGFDFGVKYQETINGSIYYDFTTGKETQEAAYKQDYSLDFSLYINIDDNDLINCKTLFDVDYSHGDDIHHQVMFAELMLDYDMTKTDANYKLKLYAADDCSLFQNEEEKHFSAEFDYVDVSNDSIKEWGKIGYSTNKAIVLDNAHDSLTDYFSDGNLKFKPTVQLYRNGMRYQQNQLDNDKANQAATIACDELGVNGTDIKYKEYISQPSTPQPVLKTCFDDFSKIFGRDLMYNIVYTGAKKDDQGGQGGDEDRVDSSWPSQGLIDDGYGDVPGFLSKTATFSVTRDYSTDTESYFYIIQVEDYQPDDFGRYIRTLIESGFVETKGEEAPIYLHNDGNGGFDYAVSVFAANGIDTIVIGKVLNREEKENIAIQNANDYTGDYSSCTETSYQSAAAVAQVVETVSGGRISVDSITQYVVVGSSKSYEIKLDKDEFANDDLNRNFTEYIKSYSGWKVIDGNGAFYTTASGYDILVMIDKDSSAMLISIHSFAFLSGSIDQILSGQGGQGGEGGEGGEGGGGGSQVAKVTVSLYEVNPEAGIPNFIESREFDEGTSINLKDVFGKGEYYADPGCAIALPDDVMASDGLSVYRKVSQEGPTQGSIVIVDANTNQELFSYTDVIGATVKGGQIFDYVLYSDLNCGTIVGLTEEITIGAEPITLYCKDNSAVDYVTLTINTYINGILSPYRTKEFGVRRGKIMSNYSSNSFPSYYADAYYFDENFTMTLNGAALGAYSQDLVALTDNSVLNIYCNNDWCKVYHLSGGQSEESFDIIWETGDLVEGDVVLHGSRYYTISSVNGSNAGYNKTQTAYTYSLCSVYNGKVITTQKDYFAVNDGQGMSFMIDPNGEPVFFLDAELKNPLTPEEGKSEVMFTNSFTLYTRFSA